jgi:hypothetical protein
MTAQKEFQVGDEVPFRLDAQHNPFRIIERKGELFHIRSLKDGVDKEWWTHPHWLGPTPDGYRQET